MAQCKITIEESEIRVLCFTDQKKLTSEHVVPFRDGARAILPIIAAWEDHIGATTEITVVANVSETSLTRRSIETLQAVLQMARAGDPAAH